MKEKFLETKNNMKMTWEFLKLGKKKLIITGVFSLFISFIGVIFPILSARRLLTLTEGLYEQLMATVLFIFLVEIVRNLLQLLIEKITGFYLVDVITSVQLKMIEETLKIEIKEIDKNTSGLFIDRINNDTRNIVNIFDRLSSLFFDILSNIGIVVVIVMINPYVFLYFVVTAFLISSIHKKRRNKHYQFRKKINTIHEIRTGFISELIRGIRDVRLLNAEKEMLNQTKIKLEEVNFESKKMEKTDYSYSFFSSSLRDFFDVTFYVLGTILVSIKNLTAANFLVLHMYKGRVENLLFFYDRLIDTLKDYNLSATRVFEILGDHFEKVSDDGSLLMIDDIQTIEFKNVSFAYDKEEVLKEINFSISKGERVGFVGSSGSGKSTIFNLLSGLYKINTGNIYINGIDISKISSYSLHDKMTLVSQNPYIFNFSVRDNLKLGNQKADDEEFIDACKRSQFYDCLIGLEEQLDTKVGEGGVTLSGGERQRLSIARALLKKSDVILFDEATSALDNITQDKVQQAIYGLDRNKTILIIAHRLSTVLKCDRIVVLDEGKIVDIGSHKELLKRCSLYQELYQFEDID
ncbi:MAG: ABC transporter ATP-binding protein [Firmicutes bacterium]|nr:ABC transporter ATP-binding protein [Bacillota bacterium]